jgi:putative ABC transport system ATP-binding protein
LIFDLQRERHATLVLITHDLALASRAGRVIHLRDGRIDREDSAARKTA